ncbi:hypothetical protein HIM_09022 [Hirsutella minnesotensis 3608]|uniref:Phenylalanine ammonia-lyase n=1 Tax=Hirsutella minnesotensis 3608 TaxID=1043627 RepID=A0A0F7ZSM6_9HYPO|nr:hypothetical protein HIM_09022 [Hirsutella minnesotensis 3608]
MKCSHLNKACEAWARLDQIKAAGSFQLDGSQLQISEVVAAAYHRCHPRLTQDPSVLQRLEDSARVLMTHINEGSFIYGANTGFGGCADTRTGELDKLQVALMQLTQAGILSSAPSGCRPEQAMPTAWVRAAMVVRCNATMRGHSAVKLSTVRALVRLLDRGIIPVVPLRGSISASGDLMPLSYIAGAAQGNPDILVEVGDGRIVSAAQALAEHGLEPVTLGPQEGLGLVNGTAVSAAVGALVMNHAHRLVVLTQALSAMAVENLLTVIKALHGSVASFDPFISQVRPHLGQAECAANIATLLHNSRLARHGNLERDRRPEALIQDRYSIRCAPQWLGPQLEDLLLADAQIATELRSSCENPVIDAASSDVHCGGNFQAASVGSAMEKTRLALQMMGRMLFAQLTEMVDADLSRGLPACLAADDPSLSFTFKGVDIAMAAYMAELAFLAAPVSPHMQVAEMRNQSVNSMALASARVSMQAVDVLTIMCACGLYACCQAVDLRALHESFKARAARALATVTAQVLARHLEPSRLGGLDAAIEAHVSQSWDRTGKLDLEDRCRRLARDAFPLIVGSVKASTPSEVIREWEQRSADAASAEWSSTWTAFCAAPHTAELLGDGTRVLYSFIRDELRVPFHRGLVEQPTAESAELDGRAKKTVGGWISIVHDAIRDDSLYGRLMAFVGEMR